MTISSCDLNISSGKKTPTEFRTSRILLNSTFSYTIQAALVLTFDSLQVEIFECQFKRNLMNRSILQYTVYYSTKKVLTSELTFNLKKRERYGPLHSYDAVR